MNLLLISLLTNVKCAVHIYSVSLCSRHESYLAKAASMPDAEDQSMMGRFVRVERQVRIRIAKHLLRYLNMTDNDVKKLYLNQKWTFDFLT